MKFSIEIIIGDRYNAADSLDKDQIHNWLLNMQKNDILKAFICKKEFIDHLKKLYDERITLCNYYSDKTIIVDNLDNIYKNIKELN